MFQLETVNRNQKLDGFNAVYLILLRMKELKPPVDVFIYHSRMEKESGTQRYLCNKTKTDFYP